MAERVGGFRLELDHEGIRELLQSPEVESAVRESAERIAAVAGDGFEVGDAYHGDSRVVVSVRAMTREAKVAEATDKTLTLAVQACRA
ncbi:hypothetical protein [Olsenella phocaeensis]|uniref:hypothetical protein n=1 Tax=Olsenella phocaeensis TaxID=1852385 RepID=UPI0009315FC1|nr:hypothetical protein [Olsenella phocaeensis]